jgi:alkanesulfonate monooxygenase SsuD/methylene tetrahydromethanopterin reductase-like flavin-dependent oxidoreductase (luciferase family)
MPNPNVGSKVHFQNMIEQSILAEKLGYKKVSIPEHHLINLLMMPSPLQMAVKIASLTKNISISTSVAVLPLHDMRTYAGEVATADILTDGRLILGVARGAFPWEMKRLGTPIEHSKEKFTESLEVLQKLLSEEEVSFSGKYYNFEALTIMPRPITQPIPIMIAAMDPNSIKNAALRGFHVQSTVLSGTKELLMERVNAFRDGCEELGETGKLLKLSMQRMMFVAKDEKDAEKKNKLAYEYYKRFDNMFTGPGKVKNGNIIPLPRKQSFEEMKDNLLICPINELIDKLSIYAEAGVDEFIISSGFGQEQNETIESMHKISEEIIPYFKNSKNQVA